jgi:hypothetical protein
LRFTGIPAGLLDTVAITDAHIELHAIYHFGDALGAIAFQGFALTASSDSANYDSLTTLSGNYYSLNNPILVYPPSVLDDTSSIQCAIDTAIVRGWFSASTSTANYGVIIIATNVTTIKGFASFANTTSSYVPRLVVNYTNGGNTGSVTDSTGESRFLANIPQTTLELSDPQSMFVQCGVAYRAQLKFGQFSLPKAGLILKAELELTYNSAASNLNSYAADTLFSYFVYKDSTIALQPVPGQTVTEGGNKIYRFAVVDYVRTWANGDTLRRLQFGGLRETSSLDLFAMFGTLSPVAVRPRLIVTHIVQ